MTGIVTVVVYLGIVGLIAAGGIWLGMLIAPRIGRLMDSSDEGSGDDD